MMSRGVIRGLAVVTSLVSLSVALAQPTDITDAHRDSFKFRAFEEWRRTPRLLNAVPGDPLSDYAAECESATGISIPSFSCSAGVTVPGQGTTPGILLPSGPNVLCDAPNSLNRLCDPGSRFQVLPGRTADAVAVAHCRKVGLPVAGQLYNDIAIIQHNKANGATCFYQALTRPEDTIPLPGNNIPSPKDGMVAPWSDGRAHWISPAGTHGIKCTGCHDNGAFIRSNYLSQLRTPPHALPSVADGFNNLTTPLEFVGRDFAADRSWSIVTPNAPGDNAPVCSTCHRLAVNNVLTHGTAMEFAARSTAASQPAKNPHSPTSPIWMRQGQISYNAAAEATALRYRACATGFRNSGYMTSPSGCTITPLAEPFVSPTVPTGTARLPAIFAILNDYLDD